MATALISALTYAAVAKQLDLSVASVKRLFSRGDLSLKRVDLICELLETSLAELLERARDRPTIARLRSCARRD
jgi:hypothetical protein